MEMTETSKTFGMTATYSPEDNKLRLYSATRLDKETYELVRKNGFIYAPKQSLFVAPMWTPCRARLLEKLCGEIGDEETTLAERAEQRAERFEGYQSKRKNDAESAYKQMKSISEHIPMGQPILVGHHSERRARKDADRIEACMQKTVKMWECSEYWEDRAKGVIGHANYKDRMDVRVRRVKGLEADKRKYEREIAKCQKSLELWNHPEKELTLNRALAIADHYSLWGSYPLDKYPRPADKSQYEGTMSLYSALREEILTPERAKEMAVKKHHQTITHYTEWLNHTLLRITYEQTILKAQGYKKPEKVKRELPPIVNYPGEGFAHITKKEWSERHRDYKSVRPVKESEEFESYRYRKMIMTDGTFQLSAVFITDQKIVEPPKKERVAC